VLLAGSIWLLPAVALWLLGLLVIPSNHARVARTVQPLEALPGFRLHPVPYNSLELNYIAVDVCATTGDVIGLVLPLDEQAARRQPVLLESFGRWDLTVHTGASLGAFGACSFTAPLRLGASGDSSRLFGIELSSVQDVMKASERIKAAIDRWPTCPQFGTVNAGGRLLTFAKWERGKRLTPTLTTTVTSTRLHAPQVR